MGYSSSDICVLSPRHADRVQRLSLQLSSRVSSGEPHHFFEAQFSYLQNEDYNINNKENEGNSDEEDNVNVVGFK